MKRIDRRLHEPGAVDPVARGQGTIVKTALDAIKRESVSVFRFMTTNEMIHTLARDYSVDVTDAMQDAIDYATDIGGADVIFPAGGYRVSSTLFNWLGCGVRLIGWGGDGIHDGGVGNKAATEFAWYGDTAGNPMIISGTAGGFGFTRMMGQGIVNIKLTCNSACAGVLVTSGCKGEYSRLHVQSPKNYAYKVTTEGDAALGGDSADSQQNLFDRCTWRNIDDAVTRQAHGFWLTSYNPADVPSDSNTSLNEFRMCGGQNSGAVGDAGIAWLLEDCDNNIFYSIYAYHIVPSVTPALEIRGNASTDANLFIKPHMPTGSIRIKGTASGFYRNPTQCTFEDVDASNGTTYPTIDAGVILSWSEDNGSVTLPRLVKASIADAKADAVAELANMSTSSLRIRNGSSDHVRITDNSNLWGVNIDGGNGDLRAQRLNGTGKFRVNTGLAVANNQAVQSRNAANSADVSLIHLDGSDQVFINNKLVTMWADYSPTIASEAGSITTVSVPSAKWRREFDTVYVDALILVTTKGTAAGGLTITLPVAAAGTFTGSVAWGAGANGGGAILGNFGGSGKAVVLTAGGATPFIADGQYYLVSFSYRV